MMNKTDKPVRFRTQYGSPDAPYWGQGTAFYLNDQGQSVFRDVVSSVAKDDVAVQSIANNLVERWKASGRRGISNVGALELIAKIGMILNEIETGEKP